MSGRKREKRTLGIARRADLPLAGRVRGVITIVQEDRFRMEDETGRGFLFILGRRAGIWTDELHDWRRRIVRVVVEYQGPPDLGAVALRVTAEPRASEGPARPMSRSRPEESAG